MDIEREDLRKLISENLMDVFLRLGIVICLVTMCVRIVSPFISLVLRALILAIAFSPLHHRLTRRMGGRRGRE